MRALLLGLMAACVVAGGAGADRLDGGFGNDELNGGDGDDFLSGGEGVDYLFGDACNDRLDGDDGDDFLIAGFKATGADRLNGGAGRDVLYVDLLASTVAVNTGPSYAADPNGGAAGRIANADGSRSIEFTSIERLELNGTRFDDVVVLVGFFSDPRYRSVQIVVGQYLGIALLVAVSVIASLVSLVLAPAYIGLLGLAPIAIGGKKLWELRAAATDGEDRPANAGNNTFAVAAVTAANGGDNISIYTPIFAIRSAVEVAVIASS